MHTNSTAVVQNVFQNEFTVCATFFELSHGATDKVTFSSEAHLTSLRSTCNNVSSMTEDGLNPAWDVDRTTFACQRPLRFQRWTFPKTFPPSDWNPLTVLFWLPQSPKHLNLHRCRRLLLKELKTWKKQNDLKWFWNVKCNSQERFLSICRCHPETHVLLNECNSTQYLAS